MSDQRCEDPGDRWQVSVKVVDVVRAPSGLAALQLVRDKVHAPIVAYEARRYFNSPQDQPETD